MKKYYVNYGLATETTAAYEADGYMLNGDFVSFYRSGEDNDAIIAAVRKDQVFTITREDGIIDK